MSDSSQGPGWWIASDGKWYAPELHPDAREPDVAEAETEADAEVETEPDPAPESGAAGEPDEEEATAEAESDATEAESGDDGTPDEDETPTESQAPVYLTMAAGGAETRPAQQGWTPTSYTEPAPATVEQPAVPGAEGEEDKIVVTATTNIVAGLISLVGAALIVVGSFLPWGEATGLLTGSVDGFDSNGVGTLVAGVVLAASAGLLLAGVRHWLMLVAVLASALTAIGLAIYSMFDITGAASDNLVDEVIAVTGRDALEVAAAGTGLDISYGLWMVLAGGAVGLIGAVFVRFNE